MEIYPYSTSTKAISPSFSGQVTEEQIFIRYLGCAYFLLLFVYSQHFLSLDQNGLHAFWLAAQPQQDTQQVASPFTSSPLLIFTVLL